MCRNDPTPSAPPTAGPATAGAEAGATAGAKAVATATPDALAEKEPSPPPSYAQATGSLPSDALILFQINDRVNIFYINESGQVTTPYQPSSLYLYKFKDPTMMETPAMLQVGTWVYPLVPGKSPVLQSSAGSYMFPDLDGSLSGKS